MNSVSKTACLAVSLTLLAGNVQAQPSETLPLNQETTIGGVPVACAGVGDEANEDARWPAYTTRIEFANSRAEYLSDLDISILNSSGRTVLSVTCESPWLLAKLAPGKYTVRATYDGRLTKSVRFSASDRGQVRTIVRFPELGALQ
ncbi:MAG: hypothetical protein ABL973_09890 [Micropepsaceae bacterium]